MKRPPRLLCILHRTATLLNTLIGFTPRTSQDEPVGVAAIQILTLLGMCRTALAKMILALAGVANRAASSHTSWGEG